MFLSSRNVRHLMSSICFAVSRRLASASRESNADEPPAVAQGGKGVAVPVCPACKKRINTMSQFLDHLADAMPALLNRLFPR
jgi:hypothetical protein